MAQTTTQSGAPIVRGPHAERTAAMRLRVIEAAIACLHRVGYAATTTQLVVDTAQVSRGAVVHHFPAKVDLMLAVAEHAAAIQNTYVAERLRDLPRGVERYLALTTATWEVMRQPAAQALLELMMATRSDNELAERLGPVLSALENEQREAVWREAALLGIRDRETVEAMFHLHVAAMRGIAMALNVSGNEAVAEASMRLLRRHKRRLTGELLTGSGTDPDA